MGPYLKIFHVASGKLVASIEALENHRIHGIRVLEDSEYSGMVIFGDSISSWRVDSSLVCVFGSKYLRIVQVVRRTHSDTDDSNDHNDNRNDHDNNHNDNLNDNLPQINIRLHSMHGPMRDWILDMHPINDQHQGHQVAIAYAHNNVQVWSLGRRRDSLTVGLDQLILDVKHAEPCLLYAARLHGHTLATLRLAAGTVFNQVLLWHVSQDPEQPDKRFRGHEGVLFRIRFDDEGKYMATVSDDRSIRLWDSRGDEK